MCFETPTFHILTVSDKPKNGTILLQNLFIRINEQDISNFQDKGRIYYGKAWFNKRNKDNGFVIRFAKYLYKGKLKVRPSMFISNSLIENCNYKRFQRENLKKMIGKSPKDVYLFSKDGPYLSKTEEYINFKLEGMDYLEYRTQ